MTAGSRVQPEFSVILPTRGLCPFLPETLASVLEGPPEMELLLIHDRRDGEPDLAPSLVADARVRVLRPSVPGVSNARNMALEQAVGRFIAFIDDDDVWLPGHLDSGARLFERYPQALIAGSNARLLVGEVVGLPDPERMVILFLVARAETYYREVMMTTYYLVVTLSPPIRLKHC